MKKFLIAVIVVLLLVGGGLFALSQRGSRQISTKYKEMSFIAQGEDIDKKDFARIDGQIYLSLPFIQSHLDDSVLYDENENTVVFANTKGTRRYVVGEEVGSVNGQEIALRDPLITSDAGDIMVPIEAFIYDYPVELRYDKDKGLLLMDRTDVHTATAKAPGGLNMREDASMRAPIVANLKEGEILFVYGEKGNWYRVRQENGYAGYVRKDKLDVSLPENPFEVKQETEEARREPLHFTWDYTYGPETHARIAAIAPLEGVDAICPTWFSIKDKDGRVYDRGNTAYVSAYRRLGIDVWGYLDNSFDGELTHATLSSPKTRERIITEVLRLMRLYEMPGINVDFEHTKVEDRPLITQFVRELAARAHLEEKLVSVDVTPQISTNVEKEPYDRKALAKVADYICLMAYDQHWASSPEAGSVAEYSWVEGNLNNVFRQIPRDKLILCVPFYTRLWTENGGAVSSQTMTMAQAQAFAAQAGTSPEWLEGARQHYVEHQNQKVWLEDQESLRWKISLVHKYNLAGIASWRKGFESPETWKAVSEALASS